MEKCQRSRKGQLVIAGNLSTSLLTRRLAEVILCPSAVTRLANLRVTGNKPSAIHLNVKVSIMESACQYTAVSYCWQPQHITPDTVIFRHYTTSAQTTLVHLHLAGRKSCNNKHAALK
ncbi:hypothetical protein J6590_025595 [Homalodisca vitripennis]|nr:hypothetical protein J6590_025595 [Homalodisca vitripennis]